MREKECLKKIGENITKARKAKGISSRILGFDCNIDKSNLIAVEKGRTNITIGTLVKICNALDLPMKDLFEF